jgi:hypothetical protein
VARSHRAQESSSCLPSLAGPRSLRSRVRLPRALSSRHLTPFGPRQHALAAIRTSAAPTTAVNTAPNPPHCCERRAERTFPPGADEPRDARLARDTRTVRPPPDRRRERLPAGRLPRGRGRRGDGDAAPGDRRSPPTPVDRGGPGRPPRGRPRRLRTGGQPRRRVPAGRVAPEPPVRDRLGTPLAAGRAAGSAPKAALPARYPPKILPQRITRRRCCPSASPAEDAGSGAHSWRPPTSS